MKKLILLFISLYSFAVLATDWDLFPYQQKTYYLKNTTYAVNKIRIHSMDSVKISGQDSIHFFNRNLNSVGAGSCYNEAVEFVLSMGLYDSEFIDSLVRRNDTVFWNSGFSNLPFYFLPKANIGESWTITSTHGGNDYDQITITCSAIQIETFFGLTDSVKTFTLNSNGSSSNQVPVSNFQIKLSKNYGLIEFVPFYLFMYHPASLDFYDLKLIGMESNSNKYGYEPSEFQDYFHLNAGDVLMWHRHINPYNIMQPVLTEYYYDSITQAIINVDSVVYIYNRTKKDNNNIITQINNESVTFNRSGFESIIDAPKWIGFGSNFLDQQCGFCQSPIWHTDYADFTIDSLSNDTIYSFYASAGEKSIDTSSCQLGLATDVGFSFTVDTQAGITKHCFYFWGSDCTTLIGYKIDGIQSGSLSLSVNDLSHSDAAIRLYPNPVQNVLNIISYKGGIGEIKIFDVVGKLLKTDIIRNQRVQLNLEDMKAGFYFINIEGNTIKFIKQ